MHKYRLGVFHSLRDRRLKFQLFCLIIIWLFPITSNCIQICDKLEQGKWLTFFIFIFAKIQMFLETKRKLMLEITTREM